MATKDISDQQVLQAYLDARAVKLAVTPEILLQERTGQHPKVCFRAMERACDRGYIEYGVSLRTGWLTEKGDALMQKG